MLKGEKFFTGFPLLLYYFFIVGYKLFYKEKTLENFFQSAPSSSFQKGPFLRQIRASAGSGKTYELTTSFLTFLREATQDCESSDPVAGCRATSNAPYAWPDILAVTFTNKAATEMQERIIGRLKDTALGVGTPIPGWTKAQATHWVYLILRRFGALNVRTIDSLLHLLVRLTALELDLPPNFEPVFSMEEAFSPLLDDLLEQTKSDLRLKKLLEDACQNVFFHTQQRGFMAGNILREKVLSLLLIMLASPHAQFATPEDIAVRLRMLSDTLQKTAKDLTFCLEREKLSFSANFKKALEYCCEDNRREFPPKSTLLRKSCLDECLLKVSKGKASPAAEEAFFCLRQTVKTLDTTGILLQKALTLMPFVELAREVAEHVPEFLKRAGTIPADFVPRLVQHVLSGSYGVSEAFCRLGVRLNHILVDEFQDTNREQWLAIRPLILEALSRGGSLTWVGDVKQAIYGWRGGDANLFDEILSDPDLQAVAPTPCLSTLPFNRRSCQAVVAINNSIFSRLAQPDLARSLLRAMLPHDTSLPFLDSLLQSGSKQLNQGFMGAEQQLPSYCGEGYVHLRWISAQNSEDLNQQVHDHLLDIIGELIKRRAPGDITILVRSNKRASLVAGWLMAEGIAVVTENSLLLAEHPLIAQIVALLHFLDSPDDNLAFWTFLASEQLMTPLTGLSAQMLAEWASSRSEITNNSPLFLDFQNDFPELWDKWIAPFYTDAGLLSPYDAIREALERLRIWKRFPEEAVFLRRFLEVAHAAEIRGYGSLSGFLDYWKRNGHQEKAPMPENLNAIRVMTMHKSKGLQFPIVIVPWHDLSPRVDTPPVKVRVEDLDVLTPRSTALGMEYYQAVIDNACEALHLLYVAWTRPEEELYAFLTENGHASESMSSALKILLDHLPMSNGRYSTGTPGQSRETVSTSQTPLVNIPVPEAQYAYSQQEEFIPAWRPMYWLPRLRIFRNPLETFSVTRRRRGVLAHHCLACLQLHGDKKYSSPNFFREIASQAVLQGIRTFPLPVQHIEKFTEDLIDILTWYAALPETRHWLRYGTPEQCLTDAQGKLYRADLVVNDGKQVTVVEYKTGEVLPAHKSQIQRYMKLLETALPLPVQGVLVYLDQKFLERVSFSSEVTPKKQTVFSV